MAFSSSGAASRIPEEGMAVLNSAKRIVVKIGSQLLAPSGEDVRYLWAQSLASDVVAMMREGKEVLLVSSGAVALGLAVFHRDEPAKITRILAEQQGFAALGQVTLMTLWKDAFQQHQTHVAQCLLTAEDTENRRRYINARDTFHFLFHKKIVPILNENDTISTEEMRYGDNDRLAARIAAMIEAQALIILSDVPGLYNMDKKKPQKEIVNKVSTITETIRKMAIATPEKTRLSKGGMESKIDAADIATRCCCQTFIVSGWPENPLKTFFKNKKGTWFVAQKASLRARKKWLSSTLQHKGIVTIDQGAHRALKAGGSLLPSGIMAFHGAFARGDVVLIVGTNECKIALGLIAYSQEELGKIGRIKSHDIVTTLGYSRGDAIIHRDNISFLTE